MRAAAAVAAGALLLAPPLLVAQGASGDKIVKMQTLNVRDILYVLTGGSNTLALFFLETNRGVKQRFLLFIFQLL